MRCIRVRISRHVPAFTLVELLLVMTIISVLAAVVVPKFFGRSQEARITAARQTIVGTFGMGLAMFEQDIGRYPTPEEGLKVLIEGKQIAGWKGPYLEAAGIPLDPWKRPYRYAYPSELTSIETLYDIVSAGLDGKFGTADDISNHDSSTYETKTQEP